MAILDGQNFFSNLASGDSPTAVGDTASAYVIDQQVKSGLFSGPAGAYVAPWIVARVYTAFVSGGGGTIQAVVQDSPDNVTWTDQILGTATAAATAAAGYLLLRVRLLPSMARYIRVVWRIATAVFTAGVAMAFLTLDQDVTDLSTRQATGQQAQPSGAMDESIANGVLGS